MQKVRGVWITNVKESHVLRTKETIADSIKLLAEMGFNVIFPVVWANGYTLYPSQVMERYFGSDYKIHPDYRESSFDPLDEVIKIAHKFYIKVVPWFEYGFTSSISLDNEADDHILSKQPTFKAVDQENQPLYKPKKPQKDFTRWMNALSPEVQSFMSEIICEVCQKYQNVDGIQGDERLPAFPKEGYDESTAARFRTEHGIDPLTVEKMVWIKYRAGELTKFLSNLYQQIKAINENLLVSIAPHPYSWGFVEYLQDFPGWLKYETTAVDLILPQVYRLKFDNYYDDGTEIEGYKNLFKKSVLLDLDEDLLRYLKLSREDLTISQAQFKKIFPAISLIYSKSDGSRHVLELNELKQYIRHNRANGVEGEAFFYFDDHQNQLWKNGGFIKFFREEIYTSLSLGDQGPDVARIQTLLREREFYSGEINGVFEMSTKEAIENFQNSQSLEANGKFDLSTLNTFGFENFTKFGQYLPFEP